MKASDVVGRKIVEVHQERTVSPSGRPFGNVRWLQLDNGKTIILSVVELEGDYGIEATVVKVGKGGRS
jgi:hypothetical protein